MSKLNKLIVPFFLILISLYSVWPAVIHFKNGVVEEYDGLLMVWELNQNIEKIPFQLTKIFQSNIFYPFENTLAFTHLLIPSAFLSYVPVKLSGSFVAASNFTIIFGQIVSALTVYYWLKDISGSRLSSFIGSVVLILSKIRFNYLVHLQMWTIHWWIVPSWLFWRYFKNKDLKYLYAGFIFMGITIWENVLPIYFVALVLSGLLVTNYSTFKKYFWHFMVGGIFTFLVSLPVILVYHDVSVAHGFVRTIRDAAHFSAGIDELSSIYFAPSIFIFFGLSLFKLGKDKLVFDEQTKWLFFVFAISFVFIFGPVVKWEGETVKLFGKIPIPLPYSIFYYVIPGLNALRTTSRWILLSAFSAVALFAHAYRDLKFKKNIITVLFLITIILTGVKRLEHVYPIQSYQTIPEVYKWLRGTEYKSVLELPMYTWTDKVIKKNEYYRLYYSLFHKKKMVNGVSGFMPQETERLLAESRKANSIDQITDHLKLFNPDLIVIHKDQQFELLGKDLSLGNLAEAVVWEDDKTVAVRFE